MKCILNQADVEELFRNHYGFGELVEVELNVQPAEASTFRPIQLFNTMLQANVLDSHGNIRRDRLIPAIKALLDWYPANKKEPGNNLGAFKDAIQEWPQFFLYVMAHNGLPMMSNDLKPRPWQQG